MVTEIFEGVPIQIKGGKKEVNKQKGIVSALMGKQIKRKAKRVYR